MRSELVMKYELYKSPQNKNKTKQEILATRKQKKNMPNNDNSIMLFFNVILGLSQSHIYIYIYIYVNQVIIGSDDGLSPFQH